MGGYIRVLRDMKARRGFADHEIIRRAYLYIARNESLPPQARHQAQLQLNSFDRYTRPTNVKNRCIESGRGRGIIGEFGLSRVCLVIYSLTDTPLVHVHFASQFQFRLKALKGELPGVYKATW